jgi:hypothetical protein
MSGKFTELEDSIYSLLRTPAFLAENLKVLPNNFVSVITEEFIRLDIATGSPSYSARSSRGFLIAQIFIKAGIGVRRTSVISDILDKHLMGKSVKGSLGTLIFTNSTLSHYGVDKANPGLHLSEYTINYSWSNT